MSTYQELQNKRLAVIKPFTKELSEKFGRTEEEILEDGLLATDFSGNVRLEYEDGSYSFFKYAFLLSNKTHVGVFTEHCGYHYFLLNNYDSYVITDNEGTRTYTAKNLNKKK